MLFGNFVTEGGFPKSSTVIKPRPERWKTHR